MLYRIWKVCFQIWLNPDAVSSANIRLAITQYFGVVLCYHGFHSLNFIHISIHFMGHKWSLCKQHTWDWWTLDFAFFVLKWIILKCICWFYQEKKTPKYSLWQLLWNNFMKKRQNGECNIKHFERCSCLQVTLNFELN